MSKRAEEAALKAYPIKGEWVGNQYGEWDNDINRPKRNAFLQGYEQSEKDLGWHPSTEHPPVDEEVIVLTDIITQGGLNAGFGKIAFGHIVDKDIAIDFNGWNIPGVSFWMPMPEDTVNFQKGVEEGRRLERDDLTLTWEDVYQIIMINSQMEVSGDFDISQWEDYAEEHCKEVLKRFKNLKSK